MCDCECACTRHKTKTNRTYTGNVPAPTLWKYGSFHNSHSVPVFVFLFRIARRLCVYVYVCAISFEYISFIRWLWWKIRAQEYEYRV